MNPNKPKNSAAQEIERPRGKRFKVKLLRRGTNWIYVQFDNGVKMTLLSFQAKLVQK